MVCGLTHVQNGGPLDIAVVKADNNGNLEWAYAYSCPGFFGWDHGYALQEYGSDLVIGSLSYSPAFNPNPNSPMLQFSSRIQLAQ
ncbi:MAG: hypothetical protein IPQ03_03015 [Bacteroidetes bacterium]|nr:hypothetical protein [Bacteroidota bacterium]